MRKLSHVIFAAYNDCSIRRPNAKKICEKKNWGAASKGISSKLIPLSSFIKESEIDQYRIACFHKRNGELNTYGIDSPAIGYSYFHQQLLDWIVDRMNNQPDEGPMNHIASLLEQANYPKQAIISIGATRYTEFGECISCNPMISVLLLCMTLKNILLRKLRKWQEMKNLQMIFQRLFRKWFSIHIKKCG